MDNTSSTTALLVMDMQTGILGNYAADGMISNTKKALAIAKEKNLTVIYVVLGFREGLPEVTSDSFFRQRFHGVAMDQFMQVHPDLGPAPGSIIVIKHRFSAFSGSDLDMILRAQKIQHLVLAGISTSGVVLSTLREAVDKDYKVTVLSDCCMDSDEEVHRVLMTKIFARHASVVELADWRIG